MSDRCTHIAPSTGLLDVEQAVYHADQVADRPTLSKSIIELLIEKSPAHARHAHPKLNPDFTRKEDDRFKLGTAAHALFLEGDAGVEVCRVLHPKTGEIVTDWKTGAAQEMKALARQCGHIPMLEAEYEECRAMVAALRARCDAHADGPLFTEGTAEKTLVWTDEYDVLCRARLDWIRDDHTAIHDLKSTKASASPYAWDRTGYSIGIDLQAAFYLRGCEKVLGCRPDFKFVAVETSPPFELSVFGLTPEAYALAERKISYALRLWATCLRNDDWPGYPSRTAYLEPPAWAEGQWLAREAREVAA